jgi:hypothetical protein
MSATAVPRVRPAAALGGPAAVSGGPTPSLPGSHFAAALVFWTAGALGLVWIAPDLARGAFPLPEVVAVAHLFTLGWITTSIMGALYQFLPVALAVPIRSERVARLTLALYAPGLALFVGGMLAGRSALFLPGAILFSAGLLLFCGNLAATLRRAPQRNLTWWCLLGAAVFLVVTVLFGAALSGNLRWSFLGASRFLALGVHMHVAVAGWVMLVMVGVAHRLLPMFLLSHGGTERPGALAAALLAAGSAIMALLHHALTPALTWAVAAMLVGGVLAFLVQVAVFVRHKRKPTLDPGLRLAMTALGFLLLSLVLGPLFLASGLAPPGLATAYGTALVLGGLSLFVAGHYYKIVPFLAWMHHFGPLVGKQAVPRVADLYSQRPADAAALLLGLGALGLVAAPLSGAATVARIAAIAFAAGALIVTTQMLMVYRRRSA